MHIVYIKLNTDFSISSLLPELDMFNEIYFFIEDFKKNFQKLLIIIKEITNFLEKYSFCQIRLHLVHPYEEDLEFFYNTIYQMLNPFNLEGYSHQITPRLMIFPIIFSPPFSNTSLFSFLESHFMPPGVIVDKDVKEKIKNIERIFIMSHSDFLLSIAYQNFLLNLLENMRLLGENWCLCPKTIIIDKGQIFSCIRAYQFKLKHLPKDLCSQCRYELLNIFSNTSLIGNEELVNLHFRLGLTCFEKEEIEIASKHFYQALKFVSSDEKEDVYYYLGLCQAQLGEYDLAIEYLKKANIQHYNTYFYLGFSYFQKGNFLKAKENLEMALNFFPPLEEKLMIVLYLGHVYKELKMYKDAIFLLKDIEKKIPVKEIYNLMGTCYFKLNSYEEAVFCFKKAISLDPNSAIDYANLCLALKALNKKEEAKFHCEKALSLDPTIEFAYKALNELKEI